MSEYPAPEDLQRLRRQIVKKQDQGNDGAVLCIVDEIIDLAARLESELAAMNTHASRQHDALAVTARANTEEERTNERLKLDLADAERKALAGKRYAGVLARALELMANDIWPYFYLQEEARRNFITGYVEKATAKLDEELVRLGLEPLDEQKGSPNV